MPDRITLDIIDRPPGGVLRAMRDLRRTRPPEVRALIRMRTAHFVESNWRVAAAQTPRRIAVLAVWEAEPGDALTRRFAGAREHWHVAGEVTRASFSEPWCGWTPDVDGVQPTDPEEPALILISGHLRLGGVVSFMKDAPHTVRHANRSDGYLGGCGLADAALSTISCSAWRRYADARAYAYGKGDHAEAMKRDRLEQRHGTEWFLRVRPLSSNGTLRGADPFAGLLDRRAVAA